MRIIGGDFKGRTIVSPKTAMTRPTSDRTRESLFNILANQLDFADLHVLDVFAGTGALGFEALSRGAIDCVFIENGSAACASIRQNIENLDLASRTKLQKLDATKLGNSRQGGFDLIFLDPPYGKTMGEKAIKSLVEKSWLNENATLVLEEAASAAPQAVPGFRLHDQRKFGDTTIGIFNFIGR